MAEHICQPGEGVLRGCQGGLGKARLIPKEATTVTGRDWRAVCSGRLAVLRLDWFLLVLRCSGLKGSVIGKV